MIAITTPPPRAALISIVVTLIIDYSAVDYSADTTLNVGLCACPTLIEHWVGVFFAGVLEFLNWTNYLFHLLSAEFFYTLP